ncbi:hypothetical protein MY10362_009714 [Beauveria mimosiformis]
MIKLTIQHSYFYIVVKMVVNTMSSAVPDGKQAVAPAMNANTVDGDSPLEMLPVLETPAIQSRGVTRMEAVVRVTKTNKGLLWLVGSSVLMCAFATSLDSGTTRYYSIPASGYFKQHSTVLSTLAIVTNIISAISKPFIAKLSDVTSRPHMYILALFFYVAGFIIAAASKHVSAYVIAEAFVAIGQSGIGMMNQVVVADLTPLEWRGFLTSLLSTPFIINIWFSGKIVSAIQSKGQWRWGYGMFAIIMPVALTPAIVILLYLDYRAQNTGLVEETAADAIRRGVGRDQFTKIQCQASYDWLVLAAGTDESKTRQQKLRHFLIEMDAFGLLLLGVGWSLLLLPFSLKTYAMGGWNNPSLIAVMVVGGIILVFYVIYEINWAPIPSSPRRLVLNRTFVVSVVIEVSYFVANSFYSVYWPSYVLVAKSWSYQDWVYYNNTSTLATCVFGLVAGLIQRCTHRYKAMQFPGLIVKIIGLGILLNGHRVSTSTPVMVLSSILIGGGGSFSAVASRVAAQACVPHQDVALAISLLALWTAVGRAIRGALVAVIWSAEMSNQLKSHLPAQNATDEQVQRMFNNIADIRNVPFENPVRQGAIEGYRNTLYYCIVPALGVSFIPLIAALFQSNFYLGKQQNATSNVGTDGQSLKDEDMDPELPPVNWRERLLRCWAGR